MAVPTAHHRHDSPIQCTQIDQSNIHLSHDYYETVVNMLLLDYQNVLIQSLLTERFSEYVPLPYIPRHQQHQLS